MGTSFGRGGATTFQQDLQNADCIVIQGSNMAECHPVGFRWVMKAKERGATVIHVDPRFTRTSAVADIHVPIRAGSDIAFLGGIIRYILEHERYFKEYVVNYTNAAAILSEEFEDTEDHDGLFGGWDAEKGEYQSGKWQYEGVEPQAAAGAREASGGSGEEQKQPIQAENTDPTLAASALRVPDAEAPLRALHAGDGGGDLRHSASICSYAWPKRCAAIPAATAPSAFCYAVGWTQHTVGVQYIRTAAIIQLLLGNMGRPGRRHPGAARPRLHSGLDRYSDALQPAARLSAHAARRNTTRISRPT